MKICIMTMNDKLFDDRIYWQEAISLKEMGYEITYILTSDHYEGGTTIDGIKYIKIKKSTKTINLKIVRKLFANYFKHLADISNLRKAAALARADVYHIHGDNLKGIIKSIKKLWWQPYTIFEEYTASPEVVRKNVRENTLDRLLKRIYEIYTDVLEIKKVEKYEKIIVNNNNIANKYKRITAANKVEIIDNFNSNLSRDSSHNFAHIPDKEKENFIALYKDIEKKIMGN